MAGITHFLSSASGCEGSRPDSWCPIPFLLEMAAHARDGIAKREIDQPDKTEDLNRVKQVTIVQEHGAASEIQHAEHRNDRSVHE